MYTCCVQPIPKTTQMECHHEEVLCFYSHPHLFPHHQCRGGEEGGGDHLPGGRRRQGGRGGRARCPRQGARLLADGEGKTPLTGGVLPEGRGGRKGLPDRPPPGCGRGACVDR